MRVRGSFSQSVTDSLLQRYNPFVTQVWRGNTDFSPIISKDAVLKYISKYASKGEYASESYREILNQIVGRASVDTPAATLIRRLLVSSVAERNYSAQEIMHLLMGWPLCHASRIIIVLSINNDWRRVQRQQTNSLVDHYSRRPADKEELSLFDFAKNYSVSANRYIERTKECIVRIIPLLKLTDDSEANEEFYKQQCKLYIPWRGIFEHILPRNSTWGELYFSHEEDRSVSEEFAHLEDEFEFEGEEDPALIVRDPGMVAARIHPNMREQDTLGLRPVDQAYRWRCLADVDLTEAIVRTFLRTYKTIQNEARVRNQGVPYESMSPDQREVVDICFNQLSNPEFTTKRVIVQGKAGTGKSAIIHAICELMNGSSPDTKIYQVLAPTGAAAINVDGKTIHSFLRIPINGQMLPLNGQQLRTFQQTWQT